MSGHDPTEPTHPVDVLEVGCGDGDFLLREAARWPERRFVGVERRAPVVARASQRAIADGLRNIKFIAADAVAWMREHVSPGSLKQVHVYHPQPYFDPDEAPLGVLSPAFLRFVREALVDDGELIVQTDHRGYGRYLRDLLETCFEVTEHPEPWPDAPRGRTRREEHALHKGLRITRLLGRPRSAPLPRPDPAPWFDLDRPGQHLVRRR